MVSTKKVSEIKLYYQSLDDKTECIGVYFDGQLYFDSIPDGLLKTWRHSGFSSDETEYAWIICNGKQLADVCPIDLKDDLAKVQGKFKAYLKSFKIAKINLHKFCFFDLVPQDFLLEFCEIKNKITKHVFETYEKPKNYKHLADVHRLLHKLKYRDLKVDIADSRSLLASTTDRQKIKKILAGTHHLDYNLFGTVTGRLTNSSAGIPILTMKKQYRKIIKPQNDWFLSLDYNGAELRTLLALMGQEQPDYDVHQWNAKNVFSGVLSREEAKEKFFAWLYNPKSDVVDHNIYDRKKVLNQYYVDGEITTPMGRSIKVDERKALNYLIQSTTSDIVLDRAVQIDKFLDDKKSCVSHIVHDEIVIDLDNTERDIVPEIKEMFENNKIGTFMCNLNAGQNYYDLKALHL
jgi:DNA polymerase I-like protein with 3'-5' exonuclease and polymerase domains